MAIDILELIYGTSFVTPEQCEAAAILYGRQLAAKTAEKRSYASTIDNGNDIIKTVWSQIARKA